ncbi:uncharacterized protein LOC105699593 [Orussus abietinus]|uniref:uncharacterized protein LOC105699593 n=1 Tax=Orussus abietinus TaxID=222816 RepID=UPI0006262A84|nr:uncharacterized protein LOC105699593 [Orussus abietinus]
MTGTQTLDPSDIIRDLKAAVTALERHHASTIKQRDQQRRPIYTMIPIEQKTPCRKNGQSREPVRREAECNLNVKPSTVSCDDLPKKEGKEDASRRLVRSSNLIQKTAPTKPLHSKLSFALLFSP